MVMKLNPITGRFDMVTGTKVAYQASPTAETLRDALIEIGWMKAAPVIPPTIGGIEFEDREGVEWQDTEGIEFEDRET